MTCLADDHNTHDAYVNHKCRCPDAVRLNARYAKRLRWEHANGHKRLVDGSGTRRRIQALAAIGWRFRDLAPHLGDITPQAVGMLTRTPQVTIGSARKVAVLYDELWRTPGPSNDCRTRAMNKGWPTPLELDDDLIDDPTYQPQLHRLTPQIDRQQRRDQILATVAYLTERQVSLQEIARHIGATPRSVGRYRKALREAS